MNKTVEHAMGKFVPSEQKIPVPQDIQEIGTHVHFPVVTSEARHALRHITLYQGTLTVLFPQNEHHPDFQRLFIFFDRRRKTKKAQEENAQVRIDHSVNRTRIDTFYVRNRQSYTINYDGELLGQIQFYSVPQVTLFQKSRFVDVRISAGTTIGTQLRVEKQALHVEFADSNSWDKSSSKRKLSRVSMSTENVFIRAGELLRYIIEDQTIFAVQRLD